MISYEWIPLLVGFVAGAVVAAVAWVALRATFAQALFQRTNYRGAKVPVGAGIILFVAVAAVSGVWYFIDVAARWLDIGAGSRSVAVTIAAGFGLLGLFDDLAATGDDRGFRGHLAALVKGRLTTGGLKLFGGGLLALVLVVTVLPGYVWWRMLLGAAIIALAANLGNLLDRAPARCTKVALVVAVVLFATGSAVDSTQFAGLAVLVGAAIGLVFFELREELMLGDAGANVLGAVLGWTLVATTDWQAQVVVLVVLVVLNAASERISFSKVIEKYRLLRDIDRLGRRRHESDL